MKRNLLKILPFLLLGGVLGLAAAPAAFEAAVETKAADQQVVSFTVDDFSGKGSASPGSKVTVTKNNVTVTAGNAYGTTQFRVFSGSTFSITSSGFKMSKLDFTFSNSDYTGGLNSSYTIDTNSWSTDTGKLSKQARFMSITVTLAASDVTMESIELDTSKAKLNYVQGEKLSTSGVKVTGTMSNESTMVVTDKCTFAPANDTVLSDVGSKTVTVTYPADSTIPTTSEIDLVKTYNIAVTEKPAEMVFTLVTDASELAAGDMVLIANTAAGKAAQAKLTTDSTVEYKHYLDIDSISISGNNATYGDSSSVCAYTLRTGAKAGTFAFENSDGKYIAPYDAENNGLVLTDSITNEASWTLASSGNDVDMSSVIDSTTRYLRYNSNAFRMYGASSAVAKVNLYKYSSGLEKVTLDANAKDVYEGYTNTIKATPSGFAPISYTWTTSNEAAVKIESGADSATVTVKGVAAGSANLTVTVNGTYTATCVVTCKSAGDIVITPGDYFITDLSNKYLMGSDLSTIEDVDISNEDNLFTFEFAGLGDGTYWISNKEGKYLTFRQNVVPDGKRISEMIMWDEKVDYWTITENDGAYKVATSYGSETRSISQDGDHDWLAFTGNNYVNITKQSNFSHFEIGHAPQKTKYYVEEKFNVTGLVVNAIFDNGFPANVTSRVVWDDLQPGTQATGKVTIGGIEQTVIVGGLNIFGPVAGTMEVTQLKDTYLVGEMPSKLINRVTVDYSDGLTTEENKELKESEYRVSPDKISLSTTKVVVEMVNNSSVKVEKDITVEHAKYFATNMFEIGDKVTLGTTVGAKDGNITGGSEIAMVDGVLKSQAFGYLPTPEMEFEVEQGVSAGSYAFKYNGMYLTSNGKTLDFGHVSNITAAHEDDGTWTFDYPYMFSGWDEPFYVTFTEDGVGADTWTGYGYKYAGGDYQIQGEAIRIENEMIINLDIYLPGAMTPTEEEIDCTCEMNGALVIYLPTTSTVDTKNSFTCTYVESQNDWVDDYWEICPLNEPTKHVYFNTDSEKFGVATNGDYNVMFYRDMTKDFSHEIKSLSVSIPEDMPTTVELGEPYNWVGITVKAKYDNTTKKLPLGAYEVDVPSTDTYGEKTCTVTYGTSGNKVTATFKFTVVGGYQPFIKQNTSEVWVDDTNTFTTTQEPPEGEPVTWSSSNPTIANFEDPSVGDLTSYKSGEVTIKVTSYDGYYSDTSDLVVSQRPTGITLSETEKTIKQGEKFTLVGTVLPSDARNKTVLWSTSNPTIATVNSKGEVTGLDVGDVIITGQTQGKGTGEKEGYKATCTVHVEKGEVVRVTGVSLIETKEIEIGASATLTPIIEPSNATEQSVTWESKYPEIVTVDKNGKITGKKKGTSDVTVTTLDGGFTATCRVTVKENVEPVPVSSISLDITSKKIDVDETFEIVATINPVNADDKHIDWSSSDEDVVEIISAGPSAVMVKGMSDGEATITARTNNGKTATCKITVGNPVIHVSDVSIDKTSCTLSVNETVKLNATVNPNNAQDKSVTWTSSNPSVATVDINGNVTAVAKGTAIITVTTNDGGKTATCTVTVSDSGIPVQSVTLNTSSCSLFVNDQVTLLATVNPSDATDKTLTWTSSNPSVATVDANGTVKAIGDGTAVITVTTNNGKTAQCQITVTSPSVHVNSVSLDKTSLDVSIDAEADLVATVNPTNASNKHLVWTTSDTSIVTVDENGHVKAIGAGQATITVSSVDGNKTATCVVKVSSKSNSVNPVVVVAATGGTVAAVGIGCGVGIPLGIKAKKRKLLKK